MKVAITGTTSGLGKCISSKYVDVVNFSRTNGFNINQPYKIVQRSGEADIFYNNAHSEFYQVQLFYMLVDMWRNDSSKTIVNISSDAPEKSRTQNMYAAEKAALDYATMQCLHDPGVRCNIVLVKPGYIDTPRVALVTESKIPVDTAAEKIVKYVKEFKSGILYMPN